MYSDVKILDLVGVPFKDGGRDINGLDCWGLVREIYKRFGYDFPVYEISCYDNINVTQEMERNREFWIKNYPPNIPVPCVVAFKISSPMVNHVGVYLGDNYFIHTRELTGTVIERIDSPIWRHRIEGYYTPCKQA